MQNSEEVDLWFPVSGPFCEWNDKRVTEPPWPLLEGLSVEHDESTAGTERAFRALNCPFWSWNGTE